MNNNIIQVRGFVPQFGQKAWIAPNATIIGDVITGDYFSAWFQSVIRGDVNAIRIGHHVNVQDGAIIHCTYQKAATEIGNRVSIGHRAIVHGCTILDRVLIGMGAIVMDHAVIAENTIIAAGAVVLEKTITEPNSVYAGVPARKVKDLDEHHFKQYIERISNNYSLYASWFESEQ